MRPRKYSYIPVAFLETRKCHSLRPRPIFMVYAALILIHVRSKVKLIASDRLSSSSPPPVCSWLPGDTRVFIYANLLSDKHTHIHFVYIIYKVRFLYMYIVMCVPSLVEIAPGDPELCWNTHTHIHPFILVYKYIIYFYIYIYIVMCVPSLDEISPGDPELCWNTHTHIHLYIYIVIYVPSLDEIAPGDPELCSNTHTHIHPFLCRWCREKDDGQFPVILVSPYRRPFKQPMQCVQVRHLCPDICLLCSYFTALSLSCL
jgi:hypothetical protein